MPVMVHAVDRPELPPHPMPDRFRRDVAYFKTPSGSHGVPPLPRDEYWIRLDDARTWLDDGGVEVISPLDSSAKAEIELTDEQEAWLEWMVANDVEHIRLA
jgi:hypothetical protein